MESTRSRCGLFNGGEAVWWVKMGHAVELPKRGNYGNTRVSESK